MRYAVRSLLKAREFSIVAVAITAIGIGANTAVFSIVDAVLLKPLPYTDSAHLFMLSGTNPKRGIEGGPFSYPAFAELASRDRMLAGLAAFSLDRFNTVDGDRPEQLSGAHVSAGFFAVLGINPAAGRSFVAAEDMPGGPRVAIAGRRYWSRRFGTSQRALGTTLTLNSAPYTIVGALGIDLPPPFDDVDVWTTRVDDISVFTPAQITGGLGYLTAVARLHPSTPFERAQTEIDTIAHGYARANPTNTDADPDASLRLVPMRERAVGTARAALIVLMAAVGLVLFVACANVSNLVLVRATARSREAAVRIALGASRWDVLRWLCAESLLLAVAGGACGVLLAFWSVDLAASALKDLPRAAEIAVDGRALAYSCGLSLAACLVFALAPTSFIRRQSPADALKTGARGTTNGGRRSGRVLVVAEVALSLVLLVGAGLLLHSFTRLTHVPLGFNPDGLLTLRVSLPTSAYPDPPAMRAFMTRALARLEATPGVASAAGSMALPPAVTIMAPYQVADLPTVGIGERPVGQWAAITPTFFATMGIPIVAGRGITERDSEQTPLVVVVSQGLARRAWPSESPLGRKMLVGRFSGFAEVVGVVGDVKNGGLAREPVLAMYTPYPQRPWPAMQFAIRAVGGDPLSLSNSVRAAFRDVDRDLPITRLETMGGALSDSIATERMITAVLLAFAIVALVMASAGLYGVIAYTVTRRTQEIGVRVALGADARAVVRLVAGEGLRVTAIGLAAGTLAAAAAGTLAAAAAGRAMRALLFDVSPADPATYAAVLVLFAAMACVALIIPARRALAVDPLSALRSE